MLKLDAMITDKILKHTRTFTNGRSYFAKSTAVKTFTTTFFTKNRQKIKIISKKFYIQRFEVAEEIHLIH